MQSNVVSIANDKDAVVECLQNDILDVIESRINGTNISIASVIGVLEVIKYDLLQDVNKDN